jgi:hypothetical protein
VNRLFETLPSDAQQPDRDTDSSPQPRNLAGLILYDRDLMQLLGLKKSAFYRRKHEGVYDFLLLRPQLRGHAQYSGTLIQKWIDGAGTSQGLGLRRVKAAAR